LIATYGPLCATCRCTFGEYVDHDTNLVRSPLPN
jgi:hypothetical protein